jgi:hypothetical protein
VGNGVQAIENINSHTNSQLLCNVPRNQRFADWPERSANGTPNATWNLAA